MLRAQGQPDLGTFFWPQAASFQDPLVGGAGGLYLLGVGRALNKQETWPGPSEALFQLLQIALLIAQNQEPHAVFL